MMTIPELITRAMAYDHGDARRIQHFLKVYTYADIIGQLEGLAPQELETLRVAAILHDIGIHEAEKKYGSSAGKYQESEGPAIARAILEEFNCPGPLLDRVAYLIGHHHTYTAIDGRDYQILIEADFLVNAYEDNLKPDAIRHFRDTFCKTATGLSLLNEQFDL